jgi:hypothetical protein
MRSKELQTLRRGEQYLGLKKLTAGGMIYNVGGLMVNRFRLLIDHFESPIVSGLSI